jgi:trehalose synthase
MGLGQFTGSHEGDVYSFGGQQVSGKQLRETIHQQMYSRLMGANASYNLKFGDGVASTTATVITATLGIKNISKLKPAESEKIKRLHLLLAFYNAFQPGVFALSGWDLVGALTLPSAVVKDRLADGDTRWINRGAYDLIGSNPQAKQSPAGLPRAIAIYGSLPQQLKHPDSFASQLARMLKVRADLRLYAAELVDTPAVRAKGLFVMVHRLPDSSDLEVTAINFGSAPVEETVLIQGAAPGAKAIDVLDSKASAFAVEADGALPLSLSAYEGKAFRLEAKGSP